MGRWQRSDPAGICHAGVWCFRTVGKTRFRWALVLASGSRPTGGGGDEAGGDRDGTARSPKPHVSVTLAAIENKETFRHHWGVRTRPLEIEDKTISILADGAHWIWDAALLEFSKRDEVLDVYHALEHLSDCGKVLYGMGTTESEKRLDRLDAEERSDPEREAIRLLRVYLTFHRDRLKDRERLAAGRSIGSGQVEGACKNLIGKRLSKRERGGGSGGLITWRRSVAFATATSGSSTGKRQNKTPTIFYYTPSY